MLDDASEEFITVFVRLRLIVRETTCPTRADEKK